jgi:hypothetical protein
MKRPTQFELSGTADVFNLFSETTQDGERVARERAEAERKSREAAEIEAKQQQELL